MDKKKSSKLHDANHTYLINNNYLLNEEEKGLVYTNYDLIKKQREVPAELIKEFLKVLFTGRPLSSIRLPIHLYTPEPVSLFYINEFQYLNHFVNHILTLNDPLEKMKSIVSYTIASKHLLLSYAKPLDPVIGETQQYETKDLKVYTECIATNPVKINFYCISNNFKAHGFFEPKENCGTSCTKIQKGMKLFLEIKDNDQTTYEINSPIFKVEGLISGNRTVNWTGSQVILDKKNKIYAKSIFDIENKKGFFKKLFFNNKKERFDYFKGIITKNIELISNDSLEIFSSNDVEKYYEGNWVDFVSIDGKKTWDFSTVEAEAFLLQNDLIPSDTSLRTDISYLKEKNYTFAKMSFDMIYNQADSDSKKRKKK